MARPVRAVQGIFVVRWFMLVNKISPPVLAFFLVVLGGWAYAWLTGDWLAVALALVLAILAGDLVDALVRKDSPNDKPGRKNKKGP
jgi:hypothetical protein